MAREYRDFDLYAEIKAIKIPEVEPVLPALSGRMVLGVMHADMIRVYLVYRMIRHEVVELESAIDNMVDELCSLPDCTASKSEARRCTKKRETVPSALRDAIARLKELRLIALVARDYLLACISERWVGIVNKDASVVVCQGYTVAIEPTSATARAESIRRISATIDLFTRVMAARR